MATNLALLTLGAVGGLLAALEKNSQDAQLLAAAWQEADYQRPSRFGMTLDERIGPWSASFLRSSSLVFARSPDQRSIVLGSDRAHDVVFGVRKPSPELYSAIGRWPEIPSSYDFRRDPHGYGLPYPSPKRVVDQALQGVLSIDENVAEAMGHDSRYMYALGATLANQPSSLRLKAGAEFGRYPRSFRSAVLKAAITRDERVVRRTAIGAAAVGVFGLIFVGATIPIVRDGHINWTTWASGGGLILFALVGVVCCGTSICHTRKIIAAKQDSTKLRALLDK